MPAATPGSLAVPIRGASGDKRQGESMLRHRGRSHQPIFSAGSRRSDAASSSSAKRKDETRGASGGSDAACCRWRNIGQMGNQASLQYLSDENSVCANRSDLDVQGCKRLRESNGQSISPPDPYRTTAGMRRLRLLHIGKHVQSIKCKFRTQFGIVLIL